MLLWLIAVSCWWPWNILKCFHFFINFLALFVLSFYSWCNAVHAMPQILKITFTLHLDLCILHLSIYKVGWVKRRRKKPSSNWRSEFGSLDLFWNDLSYQLIHRHNKTTQSLRIEKSIFAGLCKGNATSCESFQVSRIYQLENQLNRQLELLVELLGSHGVNVFSG